VVSEQKEFFNLGQSDSVSSYVEFHINTNIKFAAIVIHLLKVIFTG
jgi:hypothetical protein